jgi:5-keto 4-deoxyuronate isomerase
VFSSESAFERKHVRDFQHESESAALEVGDDGFVAYDMRTYGVYHDVYTAKGSVRNSFVAERLNHSAKLKFLTAPPMDCSPL